MWVLLLIVFIILTLYNKSSESVQVSVGNYETKNFSKLSDDFFKKVQKVYPEKTLQELVMMEDLFMYYERQSVCGGVSRLREAFMLDQQMKEKFRAVDFSHHQRILKQIAEPSKLIDPYLKC